MTTEISVNFTLPPGTTQTMVMSPEAFNGETFAFNLEATKGVFNKRVVCVLRVSNYRFFEFNYETGTMKGPYPIQNLKAIVNNKHSEGTGFGMRTYSGMQSVGTWNRASTVIGEVSVFWIPTGERVYHITIKDPAGFAGIVNGLRDLYLKSHMTHQPIPEIPKVDHLGTQLEKLAKLKETGALTSEEFEMAKKKVLGQ